MINDLNCTLICVKMDLLCLCNFLAHFSKVFIIFGQKLPICTKVKHGATKKNVEVNTEVLNT